MRLVTYHAYASIQFLSIVAFCVESFIRLHSCLTFYRNRDRDEVYILHQTINAMLQFQNPLI